MHISLIYFVLTASWLKWIQTNDKNTDEQEHKKMHATELMNKQMFYATRDWPHGQV
jgi:hypothetical protein